MEASVAKEIDRFKMGQKSNIGEKRKHRKGLWSPEEDHRLRSYVLHHGHSCWSTVPINAGLQRNGKSCRLRWINYLRPGLKRGTFTLQEEDTVLTLHQLLGNKWSQIAQHLSGRTDNEIKNYWHSHLKKRVAKQLLLKSDPFDHSSSPSYASLDHQISNNTHSFSQETSGNNSPPLPKLLFAEWLSLDQNMNVSVDSNVKFGQDHQVANSSLSEMPTYGIPSDLQFAHDHADFFTNIFASDFKFDPSIGNGNANGDCDPFFGDYVIDNDMSSNV